MRAVFTARLVWLLMEISDNSREMENYDQPESHVPCHHITCCRTPAWIRVYSFLTCRFLAKHLKHPPWFQAGEGVADRIWLRPAAVPAGFYWKKTLKTDRNSLRSLFLRMFERLLSVLSSPVSS